MIDLHSHILPGIDDGPRTWQDAMALCRRIAEEGITTSVATPHLIDGVYDNILSRVAPLVQRLEQHLCTENIPLTVLVGAEVDFSSHHVTTASRQLPTLGGGSAVLLEMPVAIVPPAILETIFNLRSRRLVPVIAHPERNELLQDQPGMAVRWVEAGALLQIDGDSLLGAWGRRAKRCAETLLLGGLVHAMATDAHSVEKRPPRMRKAVEHATTLVGTEALKLVTEGPRLILAGETPATPLYAIATEAVSRRTNGRRAAHRRNGLLARLFSRPR